MKQGWHKRPFGGTMEIEEVKSPGKANLSGGERTEMHGRKR